MATIDTFEIEQEIAVYLKNQDILSTTTRGVTTVTQTNTAVGSETFIKVDNTNVKNVRSVEIDDVAKTFGTDYTVTYESDTAADIGKVNFASALSSAEVVDIEYDYGASDRVYTDFPRTDLSLSSYPRISIGVTTVRSEDAGVGGESQLSDIMLSITYFGGVKKVIKAGAKSIRNKLQTGAKNFYNFGYIRPMTKGPLIHEPNRHDDVDQLTDDYIIEHELEVNT